MSSNEDEMGINRKLLKSSTSWSQGVHLKLLGLKPTFSPLTVSETFEGPERGLNVAKMVSKFSKMAIKVFDFS
jgi:hypothetical protein